MDEKTFDLINKISLEHCNKQFGYLDKNDMKNEIWVICLDKLKDFDYSRGELEHFLRVAVKNRLVNRFKDITKSVRSPCPRCPYYAPDKEIDCLKFGENRYECSKWRNFQLSTTSRNSLLNATEPQIEQFMQDDVFSKVSLDEIKNILINRVDKVYIRDLEQLISGAKISKQRLRKLRKVMLEVLQQYKEDSQLIKLTVNKKSLEK